MRYCPSCYSIYTAQVEHCGIDGDQLLDALHDPLIGRTLDRYEVEERIGLGGNGVVYRVAHLYLQHRYAMKVLFGDLSANRRVVERFRREAQAVSVMRHPNVVAITDFGTTTNGLTFLVMELLQGETLNLVLQRGPLSAARTARIARQIAAGLGEAHRLGYVHRDVKPANVMVQGPVGQEAVKLLDFGVVGHTVSGPDARITTSGQFVGTPLYMAPEQAREPERVRAVSDLYALGVIMFEMLCGHPPFDAMSVLDILIKHRQEPPPPMPASGGLERLVEALLCKQPEGRPQSADEVIRLLDRLHLMGDGPGATTLDPLEPASSPDTLEMGLYEDDDTPFPMPEELTADPEPSASPVPSALPSLELSYDFLHGRLDSVEDRILATLPAPEPELLGRLGALRERLRPGLQRAECDALAQGLDALEDLLGK